MTKDLKVVHVINSLSAGGAEVFVAQLTVAMAKKNCDMTVITYAGTLDEKGILLENSLLKAGIKYIPLNIKSKLMKVFSPIVLINIFIRIKPDIVHSHLVHSDFLVAVTNLLMFKRLRVVRTIHSMFAAPGFPDYLYSWLDRSFNKNIACSQAVLDVYPYLKFNQEVIENGIELPNISSMQQVSKIRNSLDLKNNTKLFLCVGSFSTRGNQLPKAQDIIIKSLLETKDLDYTMCFLGQGKLLEEMKRLAKDYNVFHKCLFPGGVTNPHDYINAADCVVQPSRFEGLSIACIESVCLGKPVILTNIKASVPFFKKGTLICDVDDPLSLANSMREYFFNDKKYNLLALSETSYYKNKFNIDSVAKKYIELYKSLIVK